MRVKKTKKEANQDIINEYLREHGEAPRSMREIAAWAVRTGRWEPQSRDVIDICARDLAAAARDESYTDPQGRKVRKKHVIRTEGASGRQLYLWADIEDATAEFMRLSLSQRRGAVLNDCKQLRTDQDSYNDNNVHGAYLEPLDFNFNADLDEMSQPTDYPDRPPDEI